MQVSKFNGGGFVAHKIRLSFSPCKFSAWYDSEGNLVDSERFDRWGRRFEVIEDSDAHRVLKRIGRRLVNAQLTES